MRHGITVKAIEADQAMVPFNAIVNEYGKSARFRGERAYSD
jgi:hypothetical protein